MSDSYFDLLEGYLQDPEEAALYLEAVFELNDPKAVLVALRHTVEVHGGMSKLAEETKLSRESAYKSLCAEGNPKFDTLNKILNFLGLRLGVRALKGAEDAPLYVGLSNASINDIILGSYYPYTYPEKELKSPIYKHEDCKDVATA